jgi:hypothetical protein
VDSDGLDDGHRHRCACSRWLSWWLEDSADGPPAAPTARELLKRRLAAGKELSPSRAASVRKRGNRLLSKADRPHTRDRADRGDQRWSGRRGPRPRVPITQSSSFIVWVEGTSRDLWIWQPSTKSAAQARDDRPRGQACDAADPFDPRSLRLHLLELSIVRATLTRPPR